MPRRLLADLDDATFDVTSPGVTDGRLLLHGWVVERHGRATVRLPVTLTVPNAVEARVDIAGGSGDLVLKAIDVTDSTVVLRGVIPCTVTVTTTARSMVLFDVGTTPVAARRWGRWRPWDEEEPV